MNELTRISQASPIVLEHPIVNRPKWLTISELLPAWAKELAADARTSVYEFEDKLSYHLEKDIINGFLDDPLRNGSRLGLRVIGPGGYPMSIEGRQLYGLFRTMDVLPSKEAILEFARRHKVRPPSWWADASKGETQPSLQVKLKPAPDRIVIEAIRCVYDAAEKGGTKTPNIKQLPAAVQPIVQQQGYYSSGRHIMRLGDAEEFKRRRRRPGKTLASERRKK
jgi:hypothetical protein